MNRPLLAVVGVLAAVLGLSACAPAGAGRSAPPPQAAADPPAARGDWRAEWDQVVAAARQEGTVVVSGPAGANYRPPLTTGFEEANPGVKVEFTPIAAAQLWPRLLREREGNVYTWDVLVNGHNPEVYKAKDDGTLVDLRAQLLLPEVLDDSKWLGGLDRLFTDREKRHVVAFLAYSTPALYVNREFVSPAELPSSKELTDPRLRGKIAIFDPRGGGPGRNQFQILMLEHGEQFVLDLLAKQDVVVTGDGRQLAEWVVRGRYPIGIGVSTINVRDYQGHGLGQRIELVPSRLRPLSTAAGGMYLPTRGPHPNAARLYANWLLTQQAQTIFVRETELNSRRLDVPPADPEAVTDPTRMDQYFDAALEESVPISDRMQELARQALR
jgi:iron(III) transport system substrate-binding protein